MDSVTVGITFHNEKPEILERAVRSVLGQTVAPAEIIIVDDGSDHPFESINFPFLDDPLIRTVRVTNRGLPAARNTVLMLAVGEAFLPLDSDDWIEPTFIEKTLPLFADADVVLVGLQEHGPRRQGAYMPGYDRPASEVTLDTMWQMNRFFYCSLLRTQLLREVGGYNPLMAGAWGQNGGFEDYDLWIDLMTREARFASVNEILFNYNTATPGSMLMRAMQNKDALMEEMHRHHRR